MKLSPLLLLASAASVAAQGNLTCPDNGVNLSNFDLPSGDDCILCVPTPQTCGVQCSCPTTECLIYSCELTPPGCGTVVCAHDGVQVDPEDPGTPVVLPECEDCTAFDGTCKAVGESWFLEDNCARCTCEDEEGTVGCVDCPITQPECGAFKNCSECLAQEGCDAWSPVGGCLPSCSDPGMPQDTSCYSSQYINGTTDAICMQAENDVADEELCGGMTNCTSCVDAVLSDGNSTCQWFPSADDMMAGYCASGCGMDGCGDDTCEEDPGTPGVLPECDVCTGPNGTCYEVGDEWFLEDGCSKCTCEGEGVGCVGCPIEQLPEGITQEGTDCGGITVEPIGCVLMDDENITCDEYVPTTGAECEVEIKYMYYARQEAPPTGAILNNIERTRDGSDHGSPRNYATFAYGSDLTPTDTDEFTIDSYEGEFHNFCVKSVPAATTFEFETSLCKTTARYSLVSEDLPLVATASSSAGEAADAGETSLTGAAVEGTTSTAASGSAIHFLSVVAVGGMFMMW